MSGETGTERTEADDRIAYQELFVCRYAAIDEFGDFDHDHHPEDCDWIRRCSVCNADVSMVPCAEHAPHHVLGLRLIECAAENGHSRTWVLDDDGYEPPCPWCVIDQEAKAHEGCEHALHGRWRRWAVTRRAALRLYALGVSSGHGVAYGRGCQGCVTGFSWGRSGYVLGWPRWKWRCLLIARHWPGEEVLREMCGKCCPCPGCGSVTSEHPNCSFYETEAPR
jgi:hypothetical protein